MQPPVLKSVFICVYPWMIIYFIESIRVNLRSFAEQQRSIKNNPVSALLLGLVHSVIG
jgi:hypothetical protein